MERAERNETWSVLAAGSDFNAPPASAQALSALGLAPELSAPSDEPPNGQASAAILPEWVQAVRGTRLWDAAEGQTRTLSIGQWQFLHVLEATPERFRVEAETSGGEHQEGWVDVDDVGVSTTPTPWLQTIRDTLLFSASDGAESSMVVAQDAFLMIAGQGAGTRLFVYLPTDPTSRRSGYGWVESDAVVPAAAPRGVALPSPGFRAVTVGRAGSYRVKPGDTLDALAATNGVSRAELLRLNGLDATAPLVIGDTLQLPNLAEGPSAQADAPRKVRDISPGWVSAEHAVVVDDASGQILWARDANTPVAPASLTKTVTALVVLDHAHLSDLVSVRVDSRRMPGSTVMGLYPGEELTVEDLLYGLMLPSGNDAALALAEHVAGTRENFVDLMNEKVRSLGLSASHFVNPHGLDAAGHVSSAYDMAMIARYGMRDSTFETLARAKSYATGHGKGYQLGNLNQLLWRYPGADGVKIGFTNAAGRAIVGSATHDGHRVYVAIMRSADIYADSTALLDWAFASYAWP